MSSGVWHEDGQFLRGRGAPAFPRASAEPTGIGGRELGAFVKVQQGSLWPSGWIWGLPFQSLLMAESSSGSSSPARGPLRPCHAYFPKRSFGHILNVWLSGGPSSSLSSGWGGYCPVRRFEGDSITEPSLRFTGLLQGSEFRTRCISWGDLAAGSHFQRSARFSTTSLKSKLAPGKEQQSRPSELPSWPLPGLT